MWMSRGVLLEYRVGDSYSGIQITPTAHLNTYCVVFSLVEQDLWFRLEAAVSQGDQLFHRTCCCLQVVLMTTKGEAVAIGIAQVIHCHAPPNCCWIRLRCGTAMFGLT